MPAEERHSNAVALLKYQSTPQCIQGHSQLEQKTVQTNRPVLVGIVQVATWTSFDLGHWQLQRGLL
jgi:hypothetical protein